MSLRNARSKQACFQGENREPGTTGIVRNLNGHPAGTSGAFGVERLRPQAYGSKGPPRFLGSRKWLAYCAPLCPWWFKGWVYLFLCRQPSPVAGSRQACGRAPPGEPGRLRGAMTLPQRLDPKLVSISLLRRRSQESGDLVVHYVCRDRADHLWQFGVRSKPACRPGRTAVRGWMLIVTRKPGRPTCGLRKACRSVG